MKNDIQLFPGERIDELYANDIKIIQSSEVFSFSLDAVLLADFTQPVLKKKGRIVDLCSGNGAVGLFLAKKTRAHITQVEVQPRLADMAQRSISLNKLSEQVSTLNIDLNDILGHLPKDSIDTITCNPPYFANQPTSKKNPNPYLALARHESSASLAQIISTISGLLKMGGKMYMVHRPDRLQEIFRLLDSLRLVPKRIRLVFPKKEREANMVLIEAIKDGNPGGLRFVPPIVVYDENDQYLPEVRRILYGTD
ncbi:MAG TPA: tRNA1(Val) (adenine(37)-N6)-methyltransferase [Candidatus Ligilactobacillus excrementavium]|nr:tRNA1(Val) (adenine(37)-N6)-methyltransferase [Candidatus Ligilactobacillus excrementavium]